MKFQSVQDVQKKKKNLMDEISGMHLKQLIKGDGCVSAARI